MNSIAQVRRVLRGQVQAGAAAFTDYWTDSVCHSGRFPVSGPLGPRRRGKSPRRLFDPTRRVFDMMRAPRPGDMDSPAARGR